MARIFNGILGKTTGKVGSIVASTRFGTNYIKQAYRPRKRKVITEIPDVPDPPDPPDPPEPPPNLLLLRTLEIMKNTNPQYAERILEPFVEGMTGLNQLVSWNMPAVEQLDNLQFYDNVSSNLNSKLSPFIFARGSVPNLGNAFLLGRASDLYYSISVANANAFQLNDRVVIGIIDLDDENKFYMWGRQLRGYTSLILYATPTTPPVERHKAIAFAVALRYTNTGNLYAPSQISDSVSNLIIIPNPRKMTSSQAQGIQ